MNHPTTYTTTYRDHPTITAGEARACLDAAETHKPGVPWKCNPVLTRLQAAGVLRRALPENDAMPIHHLTARNVLRLVLDVKRVPNV